MISVANIGIYCITNLKNNKKYIGQSRNIKYRWSAHKSTALRNSETTSILHRAIRKHGVDSFKFEVMELCEEKELDQLERKYIQDCNSMTYQWGYNIELGGQYGEKVSPLVRQRKMGKNNPMFGKKMSKKQKKLISLSNRGTNNKLNEEDVKVIKERLLNGESQTDISRNYDVGNDTINKIARCINWEWVSPELNEELLILNEKQKEERNKKIKELWTQGLSALKIKEELGCDYRVIKKVIGYSRHDESNEVKEQILKDYKKGLERDELMEKYNISRSVVNEAIKEEYQKRNKQLYMEWVELRRQGMKVKDIAEKYGVHRTTVTENTIEYFR